MTTTQSREPSAEQIASWCNSTLGLPMHLAREAIAKLAYQAGREAALAELRAGGVELPPKSIPNNMLGFAQSVYYEDEVKDYGDRRAAASSAKLLEALNEINNWLVCACIASPEDMAQSFPHMQQVAQSAIYAAATKDQTP